MLKYKRDLSPYLRTCTSLQLSPDFLVPQDMMGDDETPHSTIVDSDEPMSSSSASSGSENMMMSNMACTEVVRKKRSGLNYVCSRSANSNYKVNSDQEDMATSMISRRKGVPHRSPLC